MLAEEKAQKDPLLDPVFAEIRSFVVDATGNFRLSQNTAFLMEKVTRRLQLHGLSSLSPYLALLKNDSGGRSELDHLISELTIGETSFFRHREQFDALRDKILPEVLSRNFASKRLRIWSAGCSNGAEAYSIAIVLSMLLDTALKDWDVAIVGSDINRAFLAEAERGSYSPWNLRNVPAKQLPVFFERDGQAWSIRDRYRRKVRFVWENLLGGGCSAFARKHGPFDIVFCRNVMIYFDSENNLRLTNDLADALVGEGVLFLAPADIHQHLSLRFTSENRIAPGIFRKRSEAIPHAITPLRAPAAKQAPRNAVSRAAPHGGRTVIPLNGAGRRHREPDRKAVKALPRHQPSSNATNRVGSNVAGLELETIIDSANRGDWAAAVRQCEHLLSVDKLNAAVHYYHGLVLQYAGDASEAEKAWRRSVYLDHGLALAHYQLGLSRKATGDRSGAAKAFRNAIAALEGRPDDHPADPFDKVTVDDLRELSARQLGLLEKP